MVLKQNERDHIGKKKCNKIGRDELANK